MKKLSLTLFFILMSFGTYSQDNSHSSSGSKGSGSSETVESQVILSLAKSTARSSEEQAIDLLEKKDPSEIQNSKNLTEALRYLTNYAFSLVVRDSNKGMKVNYSDIRRRSVAVLAKVGGGSSEEKKDDSSSSSSGSASSSSGSSSDSNQSGSSGKSKDCDGDGSCEARKMINTVLSYDTDTVVLAEAAYAVGVIGSPTDDLTIEILMRAISFSKSLRNVDNNLMYACLIALEKLGDKGSFSDASNKLISEAMLDILTISGDNVKGPTRSKAMEVIEKLKKQ